MLLFLSSMQKNWITMTKFIDQKTILLFVGLSLLFLNRLTLFGVEILTPLLVFALVWYTSVYLIKRKKLNALTIITLIVLLVALIVKIYMKNPF